MPGGRLTKIVSKAKSDAFPNGCVHTAMKELKAKISKVTSGNRTSLKNVFESDEKLPRNVNPSKYVDKLIDVRDELKDKYNYDKNDEDIVDQMLKVLGKDYDYVKERIRDRKREDQPINLKKLQHELEEKFEELRTSKRKSKKHINISDDSSEDSEEPEENALSALLKSVGSIKLENGAQVFIDPKHPNMAFIGLAGNGNGLQNNYFDEQFKGSCHICGAQGHKAFQCPNKNPTATTQATQVQATTQTRPPCIHCGRPTHNSRWCWELETNAANRPPNWKSIKNYNTTQIPTQVCNSNLNNNNGTPGEMNLQAVEFCGACLSLGHNDSNCPKKKKKKKKSKKKNLVFAALDDSDSSDDEEVMTLGGSSSSEDSIELGFIAMTTFEDGDFENDDVESNDEQREEEQE